MYFLDNCNGLAPLVKLLRNGVIPAIQAAIIVVLIVLLIIDLGKAVMAGKEDEIKSAQKLAIKRVVYALVVFLVPWIVNVAIGLLASAEGADDDPSGKATTAWNCWADYGKQKVKQSNCSKADEEECLSRKDGIYWWNPSTCHCDYPED